MRVNLLPYEMTEKKTTNLGVIFTMVGLVLLAAVTGVFYLGLQGRVNELERSISQAQADFQEYARAIERKSYLDQLQIVVSQKEGLVDELSGQGVKWNLIMDEIRDIIPWTVVLDTVTNDAEGTITIAGRAGSLQAISQYLVNVQKARYVTAPDIQTATWSPDLNAFMFVMTCAPKVVPEGG